jgi:large subunit ribosomal protein L17
MRHNKHHASLGVTREHRRAMLSNLAASLITHGRIQTTLTKAKALRPFVEQIITKAKRAAAKTERKDAVHLRRLALADVRDENAVTKLFNELHKEFANRNGGYTRIYKLGPQRQSDAAELALIEFVKADDPGYKKSKGRRTAKSKAPKPAEAAPAAAPAAEAAPKADEPKA